METYILSAEIHTDLDPSQLLALWHEALEMLAEEIYAHGGDTEKDDETLDSAAVTRKEG